MYYDIKRLTQDWSVTSCFGLEYIVSGVDGWRPLQESWPDVLKAVSQLDQMLLLDGKGSKVKSDGADAPGDVGEGPDQALRPEVMQRVRASTCGCLIWCSAVKPAPFDLSYRP